MGRLRGPDEGWSHVSTCGDESSSGAASATFWVLWSAMQIWQCDSSPEDELR